MMGPTEICNLALDAAGSRHTISSPTEVSREAEVCNRWYPVIRDLVFRAAFWPNLSAYSRLALLAERDADAVWTDAAPDPGWRFVYSVPNGMIAPRYLSDFSRFILTSRSDNAAALATQTESAVLTYTKRVEDPDAWDTGLRAAIIYGLAANIVMPLQGKLERMRTALQIANESITQARANNANVAENQYDNIAPWHAARGFSGDTTPSRFFYPYGPMLNVTEGIGVT